ncbi:sugar ABC transporter substrate-binding protein [Virgisporangium aliadipatigenens]|uniref:Sugar ABC transporter substrate-binding protein n=1 Tax=Virgisporangium aliadipatigenens TaxID=741659 RepID=A0A8J4DPP5_9ACTN|nr:multiple monosaccharide ABC transporter substrate-binding protein [Virgisporangium aliadipatigenens]GIJ44878.1 sugar ABC transporter substrate-binding protein [Virgisporangium aliadipatigenens]
MDIAGVRVRRRTLSAALAASAVSAAAGCASTADDVVNAVKPPDRGTVGISMPTKKQTRWIADGENMVKQFTLLGYKTTLEFSEDSVQDQVTKLDGMIGAGVKALLIGAVDGSALTQVLAKAAAAKIPTIAYDRLIRDTGDLSYYATFDNFKVGVLQANAIVDFLGLATPGGRPVTVEIFAGSPDDNNATVFYNGAMSVLRPYIAAGRLLVRSGETTFDQVATKGWDGAKAKTRMARILAAGYPTVVLDGVLAPNDGIARGILEALTEAGYGTPAKKLPVLTGQDAELESVKLIAKGQQTQTVYKDTRELAKVAVQMTNALLTGGEPRINDTTQYNNGVKTVPTFLLQPVNVDKNNYRRVLVDGGYYKAAEIDG